MLNAKFMFYNIPVSDSKNVIICSRGSHSIRGGILFLNETMYSQWAIVKMKFLVILHVSDHGEKVIFKLLWVSINSEFAPHINVPSSNAFYEVLLAIALH